MVVLGINNQQTSRVLEMADEGKKLVSWSGSCCSSLSLPQTEPRGKLSLETAPDLVWPLVSARGRGCAKCFFFRGGMDISIRTTSE